MDASVIDLRTSFRVIDLTKSAVVHVANHLNGLPCWVIFLPNVTKIPRCYVNHSSNITLKRFQDGLGFLGVD